MAFEAETIASLAIANPGIIPELEKLGIDYCCGGAVPVEEACRRAGVDPAAVRALATGPVDAKERAWDKEPLPVLIQHILNTHHVFTRRAIAALPPLAAKVKGRHGANHPETSSVETLVVRLAEDLAPHMMKEEQILFPYVVALEAGQFGGGCFGTVRNPIRVMMNEHDAAGELLVELRAVTHGYAPPADACPSFQALYAGLKDLEADLHRHIHLENNVLFPRAIALEEGGSGVR